MTAKAKILLLIGLLFSSAIFLVSGVGFSNFKSASTVNKKLKLDNQAFLISKALEQKIERYFDVLNVVANDIEIDETGLLNIDKAVKLLHIVVDNLGVFNACITTKDARTYTHQSNGLEVGFNAKEKKREWYIRGVNGEDKIITTPYISNAGNKVTALAVPLKRNGKVLGVLALNLSIHQITGFIQELAPENNIFVSRQDGFLLAAKEVGLIGKNIYDERPSYKEFKSKSISNHNYYFEGVEYTVSGIVVDSLQWTVWSWSSWNDINAASNKNLQVSLWIASIFIILSLYLIYLIVIKVMYRPIGGEPADIEAIVNKISQGKLNSVTAVTGSETGIYSAILIMVNNLKSIIQHINLSTGQLNISSAQMSESASSVNSRSALQMKKLEHTSVAMNEMAVTVDEVARNALSVSTAVDQANKQSTKGLNVVNEVNINISTLVEDITHVQQVMVKFEEEVENIGGVIDVIRGISEQTNSLALNAAIEAARAAGQGRGFTVVADEVKGLANRTQESIAEIQTMIRGLQNESKNSVELMQVNIDNAQLTVKKSQEANNALEEIRRAIFIIQEMNNQIASSAEQQKLVAADINQSIVDINDVAKMTFDSSKNNTQRATELLNIAAALNKSVEVFKL
ncbi:methyl-accepting chemotaxis protein [uncultured Psychromonas sp.]|uniref:methyl-accepting chemotaxis protein n=1 Tax=uncultured Psychromonas sp. TaxID=173974 RepID=UPI002610B696|nr:methyl-accepting chemotaxis protein [uncultured Psychromonas sp.]